MREEPKAPFWTRAHLGLVLGPALLLWIVLRPAPEGMSPEAWRVTALAALMAVWWATEAIPIAATSLLPLALLPAFGVMPVDAVAAPYANPVIFLFMGGFLIAAALQGCGLHRRLALAIVRIGGAEPPRLVGSFMVASAAISMWVSNTATVAMLLPMALSVIDVVESRSERAGAPPGARDHFPIALLLGLAYAASIGGLGTLIGTPPNALLAGYMAETYGRTIGFVEWMRLGVPLVIVSLPLTWWLLVRVLHPLDTAPVPGAGEAMAAQARDLGAPSRAEWIVGAITLLTACAWLTRPLLARVVPEVSDAGIAIAGALLLFVIPVGRSAPRPLDWAAAERLPWGVLVLFGGGLSLAGAIQHTGLAEWIGQAMGGVSGWPALAVVLLVTTVVIFLTELTSNTATAAALLPVMAALAVAMDADPMVLAVPTALAASCAFMMPVATPPNAIVFGSGRLTIPIMARAGLRMNLIFILIVTFAGALLARFVLVR